MGSPLVLFVGLPGVGTLNTLPFMLSSSLVSLISLLMRYDWLYLLGFSGSNSLNLTTPLAGLESSLQAYLTLWFWECGNDIHYVRAV